MSSDDADDERDSPPPIPVEEWVNPKHLKFTMFVVLPNEEVCTLRELPSGIAVFDVKGRLELYAGLPASLYTLIYPDGEELPDDQKLLVQENILHGYVMKVQLHENWESLYFAVTKNSIEQVYHSGVHLKGNITVSPDEKGRYETMVRERGGVALYIACFLGLQRMVGMLLSVGVDPNTGTLFGRRPIHASVARDHVTILDMLNQHGASLMQADCFGVTPLDIAREMASGLCTKRLRLMLLNLRGSSGSFSLRHHKKLKPAHSFHVSRGAESCPPGSDSGYDVTNHDVTRTRSTLSQYSEDISTFRSSPSSQNNKTRKSASSRDSSAQIARTSRVLSYRPQINDKVTKSDEPQVTHPKRAVKWRDAPADSAYWNVVELPLSPKDSVTDAVEVKPVAIIRSRKLLKFDKRDGKADVKETVEDKEGGKEVPMKPQESAHLTKAARLTKSRLRHFSKMNKVIENRSMRRIINIVSGHQRIMDPEKHGEAFKRWLQRKAEEEERANDSDDSDLNGMNVSDSEDEKMREFNKKVRKMNKEPKHQTPGNRPVPNLISIGSTQLGNGANPPPDNDHTAYREWRRRKMYEGSGQTERKTVEELMMERKRLEERRQKLLLNAITYDEWMDHAEERKYLIKQILQADYMEMRKLEEERFGERVKLYSYDLWKEKIKKREAEERKRKLIQQKYEAEKQNERVQFGKSSAAVSFDVWKKKKVELIRTEKEQRSKSAGVNNSAKKDTSDKETAYEKWLERKREELTDIDRRSS